ncbi:hypothetical protein D8I24_4925 [Cupriavidus necator H850]|nr:hypothetical protein D8I24_4925 [Cupriavidus necator H850]
MGSHRQEARIAAANVRQQTLLPCAMSLAPGSFSHFNGVRERRDDIIRRHIRSARWRPRRWMARNLRFVFANEPVERLAGIRERIRLAWDI